MDKYKELSAFEPIRGFMDDMKLIEEKIVDETGDLHQVFEDEDGNIHEIITDNDGGEWEAREYFQMLSRYL